MAPTFILTRTFAISALLVGAFPISYAAPIPTAATSSTRIVPRGCRQYSCLYSVPTGSANTSDLADSNDSAFPALQIPPGGFSQESMQMLDFLISALTSARSAAESAVPDAVQPTVKAVTMDGFVPVVDAVVSAADELAAKISESSPIAGDVVEPARREVSNLDALV